MSCNQYVLRSTDHNVGKGSSNVRFRSIDHTVRRDRDELKSKMRRNKLEGASGGFGGDWSDSGTFLRKPASGWLHDDTELMDNSCINYEVEVHNTLAT